MDSAGVATLGPLLQRRRWSKQRTVGGLAGSFGQGEQECGTTSATQGQGKEGGGRRHLFIGVVKAARKDSSDLLSELQAVVHRAVIGYGRGRAARRLRAQEQRQPTVTQAPQAAGRQSNQPAVARQVEPTFCRPVSREDPAGSEWTTVEGKRKQGTAVQQWTIDPLVGGLLGFGVVKRRLADGVPLGGHLVVASDQAELDTITSLARSHELKEALSVICRFVPTGEAKTMQLPSVGPKGQKQVRAWPAVAVSAGTSPAPQRKAVLKATFAAPDRKLVTLRLQVPKAFHESSQWESVCKQPNDLARRSLGPVHSFGLWQKIQSGDAGSRELVLECYAKIAEGDKAAVLANSGVGGVFAAELTRDQPKPAVDWIPSGDVVGPAYLQLVQRQAKAQSGAIAFRRGGGASLGIRIDPNKAGDRVQTWRARKVPRDWTEDDLRGAFEAASFSDFEVVAPGRGALPWLLRAKLKGDEGLPALVIETSHHCIDVERAVAKRRLENVKAERLPTTSRREVATKPAPTPDNRGTAPMEMEGNSGKGKATGKTAPATTEGGQQGTAQQAQEAACSTLWGFIMRCTVTATVGRTPASLPNVGGATLRTEVASYIKEKPQHFKPFWLPPPAPADETERINLEQMEGGSPPTSWESYLDALDRPGRRADDLTFRALTRRLNCRILLLVGDVKSPEQIIVYGKKVSFQDDRKQVVIPVLYKERHYQLVAPKPGREIPTEWLAREPGGQSQTDVRLESFSSERERMAATASLLFFGRYFGQGRWGLVTITGGVLTMSIGYGILV
eukprot:s3194_g2.t1